MRSQQIKKKEAPEDGRRHVAGVRGEDMLRV